MKTKNELRNWAKNLRKKLDMNTISLNLCQKLISLKEYKNAKNIMLFRNAGRFCSPGAAPYSRTRGTRAKPKGFPGGPGGDITQ